MPKASVGLRMLESVGNILFVAGPMFVMEPGNLAYNLLVPAIAKVVVESRPPLRRTTALAVVLTDHYSFRVFSFNFGPRLMRR